MRIDVKGIASEEKTQPVPEGEQLLTILSAACKTSQAGNEMLQIIFKPLEVELAACDSIFHHVLFPAEIDRDMMEPAELAKAEAMNRYRKLDLQSLMESAEIPFDDDGFDLDDFGGKEVTANVIHETGDRGIQARIKFFVN